MLPLPKPLPEPSKPKPATSPVRIDLGNLIAKLSDDEIRAIRKARGLQQAATSTAEPLPVVEPQRAVELTMPKVTGVLVFGDPARLKLAQRAVNVFLRQIYPNLQLVIVNATRQPVTNSLHPAVVEITAPQATIGTLRNIGVDKASGDWILMWDDDDWSHPWRIVFQMACRPAGIDQGTMGVVLSSQIRCHVGRSLAFMYREPDGIPSTLLYYRGAQRYPDVNLGDTHAFMESCRQGGMLRVVPELPFPLNSLSTASYHGRNLTGEEEFMRGFGGPAVENCWKLGRAESELLAAALRERGFTINLQNP